MRGHVRMNLVYATLSSLVEDVCENHQSLLLDLVDQVSVGEGIILTGIAMHVCLDCRGLRREFWAHEVGPVEACHEGKVKPN